MDELPFTLGDPDDLSAQVKWAFTHPREMAQMGQRAREALQVKYTADRSNEMLMTIYQQSLGRR